LNALAWSALPVVDASASIDGLPLGIDEVVFDGEALDDGGALVDDVDLIGENADEEEAEEAGDPIGDVVDMIGEKAEDGELLEEGGPPAGDETGLVGESADDGETVTVFTLGESVSVCVVVCSAGASPVFQTWQSFECTV
jgi:hypothetical protein